MFKKIFIMMCIVITTHEVANAGGAVAGAMESTQLMNNIQLIASYGEQATQTIQQINQYKAMLKNLENITPSHLLNDAATQLFVDKNMMKVFTDLRRVVVNGSAASYSLANMDSLFKQLHPEYGSTIDFQNAYRNWSNNTLDSVKNSLAVVTAQSESFSSEEAMVKELLHQSSSADGQLKALQAGNNVGIQMIGQMQKLRQLQMAQIQSQNTYVATQQN